MRTFYSVCSLALTLLYGPAHAGVVLLEDFEDAVVTYTTSSADSFDNVAAADYFGRTNLAALPSFVDYFNVQGSGFYAVQDTPDAAPNPTDSITLDWTGIDISTFTSLSLSWYVAEDGSGASEHWDADTSLQIQVRLDGGSFETIFGIEAESVGGTETDQRPLVDTGPPFDGIGDGTEITDTFTQFSSPIDDGLTLDIRLILDEFDAANEDVAFDNLMLTGTAIPEPSAFGYVALLLPLGISTTAARRIRRRTESVIQEARVFMG